MKTAFSLILNFGFFLFAVLPVFSYEVGLYSEGEYTVDETGSFNYSLPLDVPAGRGMIQPSLSVNYNSNGGDGLLGKGWSLGGLSSIHRCAPVKIKDGFVAPINFDNKDRFCLDGERLIPVSGGSSLMVNFQTEKFSHAIITGYRSSSSNINFDYFRIWDANGVLSEYGNTVDSRIESTGVYGLVMAWALNKVQDRNDNLMEISYVENTATGEYYPDEIKYVKYYAEDFFARIKFNYADRSKNGPVAYTSGSKTQLTKQLSSIVTQVLVDSSWTTHKQYSFSYSCLLAPGASTNLTQIQECAYKNGTPNCLNPLYFHYNTQSPFSVQRSWISPFSSPFGYFSKSNSTGSLVGVVDLDGDGLSDIYDAANGILYRSNGKNGFVSQSWPAPTGYTTIRKKITFGTISEEVSNLIDFNGDGLPDYFDPATRNVWLNTGSGFATAASTGWNIGRPLFNFVMNPGNYDYNQTAGLTDLNRDGLIDFYEYNC